MSPTGLKEFLESGYEWFTFTVDKYDVHLLFENKDSGELTEGKNKGVPLGGVYSAQLHKAHPPIGQEHIHVYAKNNQLFALNKDGSAHDASHKTRIPNKVAKAIQDRFPAFVLPPDNFIESASPLVSVIVDSQLLTE